jgi:16S rRNA C967 or C1407 C5-methylase (RsmB/RsmF family)
MSCFPDNRVFSFPDSRTQATQAEEAEQTDRATGLAHDEEWEEDVDHMGDVTSSEETTSVFESYYRVQGLLESEDEWQDFLQSLKNPLPVTFRINRGLHSPEMVEQCLGRARHILQPRDCDLPFEHGLDYSPMPLCPRPFQSTFDD